jgi:hypothetical protein
VVLKGYPLFGGFACKIQMKREVSDFPGGYMAKTSSGRCAFQRCKLAKACPWNRIGDPLSHLKFAGKAYKQRLGENWVYFSYLNFLKSLNKFIYKVQL